MKGKIIILESAPACYKTTVSNILREQIKYSNLLRLNGLNKECDNAINAYLFHSNILNAMDDSNRLGCHFIMDRSHITNLIYTRLGFKDYSFEQESKTLLLHLKRLSRFYEIYYITLTADEESFRERLNRDKSEYIEYSLSNSLSQQEEYLKFYDEIKIVNYMKCVVIDTSNRASQAVAEEIITLVGE